MSRRLIKKKWKLRPQGKDTSVIPKGHYCYGIVGNTMIKRDADGNAYADPNGFIETKRCPYWSINPRWPKQSNGYCSYGEVGDWQENRAGWWGMLWDQLKSCDVNRDDDDEEENLFGIPIALVE